MRKMIRLENVAISFGDTELLRDITFNVAQGERVSLTGPGGCGKTTILKILLGLIAPSAGVVVLADTDMVQASDDEKQKTLLKVGMAFQQGALFDFMSVEENLMFALKNMTSLDPKDADQRIEMLLQGVKLAKTRKMLPYELSGGMQRRVGIARALATDPEIAVFDEPTAGLDPVTSTIILNMIRDMVGDRTTLVCTSNIEVAIRYADRLIVVNEGKVVADGLWRELLLSGPPWVQNFISVRLIGLDYEYAELLDLPPAFLKKHWRHETTHT